MHSVRVRSKLVYEIHAPTTLLVNVAVATTPHQAVIEERFQAGPTTLETMLTVGEHRNRFVRLVCDPGIVSIAYSATVRLTPVTSDALVLDETAYNDLPAEVLPYLNPSRYCESDRLMGFAMAEFGHLPQNFQRVDTICDWIHDRIAYRGGTTTSLTTACDVLLQRTGVCRDFAHLAISFCRAIGVPARYVSGYACQLEPPDFHGFFEAYLDGRWYLFDPTRLAPAAGLVRISTGRDAADVAFATIWGDAIMTSMTVDARNVDGTTLPEDEPRETAVSTA
jgi:transglutaminase-like putative cysteine protease